MLVLSCACLDPCVIFRLHTDLREKQGHKTLEPRAILGTVKESAAIENDQN